MFDYTAVNALAAVIEVQGFAPAAKKLRITQSAVSQRIASIENFYGQRLLIREQPYRLTILGEKLVSHLRQVHLIEADLVEWTHHHENSASVRIAVNRDSLDLWFYKVFADTSLIDIKLEMITSDENLTLDFLRSGQADLAISAHSKPPSKCEVVRLGKMTYQMASTPKFKANNFASGFSKANIRKSTAIMFDEHDRAHNGYLASNFGLRESVSFSLCPSTKSFKQGILLGHGYGLLPHLDMMEELKSGELILLDPKTYWSTELYLHSWQIQSHRLKTVKAAIEKVARLCLGTATF